MNQGKIAIVTGGASGIGLALCHELASRGIRTIIADIHQDRLKQAESKIRTSGGLTEGVLVDVSEVKQIQSLVRDTFEKYGRLDYMFNNAGVGVTGEVRDMDVELWQRLLGVNLHGVIYGSTAAYEVMIQQGFGHIINVASLQGLIPLSISVPYTATKYAVVGFSLALRPEAAENGVKITVVCPGFIETEILNDQPFINVDKETFLKTKVPGKKMSACKCAQIIMRGVDRNRAMIAVPRIAYVIATMHRFFPFIMPIFNRKLVRDFKALKPTPGVTNCSEESWPTRNDSI